MIEQGIVMLVQNTPAVANIATQGGGYLAELPKDQMSLGPPSWTYIVVSNPSLNTLTTFTGFASMRLQIDCYGNAGADVILLAAAINKVLNGFRGTLPDSDSTYVDSCFQNDMQDFPLDEYARTFRRMLEFEIFFAQV